MSSEGSARKAWADELRFEPSGFLLELGSSTVAYRLSLERG
jgi:hypothetical protein